MKTQPLPESSADQYVSRAAPSPYSFGSVASGALVAGLSLWILAALSPSFSFTSPLSLVVAMVIVGLVNAVIAPVLSWLTLPLSVLTLGLSSMLVDGALLVLALELTPGVEFESNTQLIVIALANAVVSLVIGLVLSIDDPERVDRRFYSTLSKRDNSEVAGTVFIQIDGLGYNVLRRAVRDGNAPAIAAMIRSKEFRLHQWETDWSSQTGASQRAILMGSNENMPAFRWYEKSNGRTVVSNKPESARYLESLCDPEAGLLLDDGLSVANIYTGGAKKAIFTVSVMSKKKGRIGQGYGPYFAKPYNATRTAVRFVAEFFRELRGSRVARQHRIYPSIRRPLSYAVARAGTTIVMQDVSTDVVLDAMASGRKNIFVDYLGYDEVAHHVGPERADALEALRRVDEHVGRIVGFAHKTAANYRVVLLSDHGQSQGQTFLGTYGESLGDFVQRTCQSSVTELNDITHDSSDLNAPDEEVTVAKSNDDIVVMASGSLGLIYFRDIDHRATLDELKAKHPGLIDALVTHPGVGFVMVRTNDGAVVLGAKGEVDVESGRVTGENPLALYGERALQKVQRTNSFPNTADIMVNAQWNPDDESIGAFEELVGSHGGMGGEQMYGFVLLPAEVEPEVDIFGAESVHRILKAVQAADQASPARIRYSDRFA